MDSLTQALLGASLQGAVLGRLQGRKALLYGAALGTLPDLDVVIHYGDAIAQMTYHRGFSHSLLLLSALAVGLTLFIRRFKPNPNYSSRRLFFAIWLVLITHPILDAFTSYGTQLLWPWPVTPVAWSNLFIIDPLYSLPLLAAVLIGLIRGLKNRSGWLFGAALIVSSLYLLSSLINQQLAERRVLNALAAEGITAERVFSTPTPFNTLLWRVLVTQGDSYFEAITNPLEQQPPQLLRLPRGALKHEQLHSPQLQRLRWFSDDWLRYDVIDGQLIVTDLRMGMPGYHPFRFAVARLQDGHWQASPWVERYPSPRGELAQLKLLWQRLVGVQPSLPLEEWVHSLTQPAP